MKNRFHIILIITLIGFGCNTAKISRIGDYSNIDFDFFSNRSKVKVDRSGLDFTLLLNLRIKDDSLIWMNLSNTLVGKIGKCKLTKDSIHILKDVQGKEVLSASIEDFSKRIGFKLSYGIFQNILLGNMPLNIIENTSLTKEKDGIHIIQNVGGFVIENVLNPKTKKLNRLRFINGSEYVELVYSEYQSVEKHIIPSEIEINSNLSHQSAQGINGLKIIYQKNTFTKDPISFPFKVSSKYVRKSL